MDNTTVERLSSQLLDIALGSDLEEDMGTSGQGLHSGSFDENHILRNSVTITPGTERDYQG